MAAVVVALTCSLADRPAHAQQFGGPGELVLSDGLDLNFTHTSGGGASDWTLNLAPSVDFFILPLLSVGGSLLYNHQYYGALPGVPAAAFDSLGILARVGFDVPLGPAFSLWPQLSLQATADPSTGLSSGQLLTVGGFVPMLVHPVRHFFIGLGPYFAVDIAASDPTSKQTVWGLQTIIGGWVGGPQAARSESTPQPEQP